MQDTVRDVLLGHDGLFEKSKGSLIGKQRVDLLKAIEGECSSLTPLKAFENDKFSMLPLWLMRPK